MMAHYNDDDLIILSKAEVQSPELIARAISRQMESAKLSQDFARANYPSTYRTRPIDQNPSASKSIGAILLIIGGTFALVGFFGNAQFNRGKEAGLAASQELIIKANQEKAEAEARTVQAEQQINQIRTLLGQ